jgi:hypothetical protein
MSSSQRNDGNTRVDFINYNNFNSGSLYLFRIEREGNSNDG